MENRKNQGFTLIEVAIVLIIIALLTGGVMKGLELLETSRIQKASEQLRGLGSAWYNYLNRFKQFPGDDSAASSRFGSSINNGNGDNQLSSAERSLVWQHLHSSNMIIGEGTNATLAPWGNSYEFIYQGNNHFLCIKQLSGDRAQTLDSKLDNGKPNSGNLAVITSPPTSYNSAQSYDLCYKL